MTDGKVKWMRGSCEKAGEMLVSPGQHLRLKRDAELTPRETFARAAVTLPIRSDFGRGKERLRVGRARVLDVGNCDPDFGSIRGMLVNHFDVDVDRVMFVEEALTQLATERYDLILVNRRVFADDSDGMDLLRRARPAPNGDAPVMLVSNFADAQDTAESLGAVRGFGKGALQKPETIERLAEFLPRKAR